MTNSSSSFPETQSLLFYVLTNLLTLPTIVWLWQKQFLLFGRYVYVCDNLIVPTCNSDQ